MLIDPICRDGDGWLARLDLPHGVTASRGHARSARNSLPGCAAPSAACGPRTIRKRHPGALSLFVGDEDMSQAEQPAWPLAKRGAADMFSPVPFATDQRGQADHGRSHVRRRSSSARYLAWARRSCSGCCC